MSQTESFTEIPDYQREFSKQNIKNYIAGIASSFGTSGFSAMLFSGWLTFVYTEYLGVNAAAIAAVVSVSIIVDGVSDFIMGIVMDRVTSKWGKAKHWFFVSAVPIGATMILMWMIPESTPSAGKALWAFVMYNIFCTFLTTVRMSAQAFPALISDSTKVQSNMSYVMNICAAFSSAALGWIITPVTSIMGENLTSYRVIALICGIVTMICLFICGVLLTEQRDGEAWKREKELYRKTHQKEKNESIWEQLKNLLKNKYWVLYLFINLLNGCSVFFGFGVMAYWLNFVLDDMTKTGIMMTILNIPCLIGTFLFMPISRKVEIKAIAIVCTFGSAVLSLVMWIAGAQYFSIFIVAMGIKSFIGGVQAPVAMVVIPRIIDYGEWKTGSRQEGLCNAGTSVSGKIMSALATTIVGVILAATGYTGGGTITASAINAINILYLGIPTIAIAVAGVLWLFFTLDQKTTEKYRAEVAERRKKLATDVD